MSKKVRRAAFGMVSVAVLAVSAGTVSLMIRYERLPADQPFVPYARAEEIVELPRRPGILGIFIDIPREKPNLFSIDLLRSEKLDWNVLRAIDYKADVRVYGFINDDGRLSVGDVIDVDHARAGNFIAEIVRSWAYKPLKRGTILFHFNLPSEGEKLIIYTAGLTRQESIDREIPILDGRLHYVTGLDPSLVRVIKNP
jgi:hypothetical protein